MTSGVTGAARPQSKSALRFVILLGIVSLFSDMTHEAARSVNGPFLAILGASGAVVGIVSGLGEVAGYAIRLISGYLTDQTRRYWVISFLGYAVNLLAVPFLALAGNWPAAATLMIVERIGKGIRVPPRDTMLSHATESMGRGWGFGLHEAMDQLGAILGPLIVAAVLYARSDYRAGYAILIIPALLALSVLTLARVLYPRPHELSTAEPSSPARGYSRIFWLYVAATALMAAGFADFPLIAYHFQKTSIVDPRNIPIIYAVAMGVDAVAALVLGRLFDRIGPSTMVLAAAASAGFAPLAFFGGLWLAILGMVFWGIGMGAQESIMRAAIAGMIPAERRGRAYGIFNTVFGIAWFLGSVVIGSLYDVSIPALVAFSMAAQLAAVPVFYVVARRVRVVSGK